MSVVCPALSLSIATLAHITLHIEGGLTKGTASSRSLQVPLSGVGEGGGGGGGGGCLECVMNLQYQ